MSNLSEVAKQPVNIPKSVPENWVWRDLVDICRPKQWATISSGELTETGYPVFGANGYIGYYPKYNHEFETIAVTCRGATCGTVNLIPEKTYITGNSMCLDDIHDSIDTKFLFYSAKYRTFSDVISGSAQPQITGEGLKKVSLPVPPLAEQNKIASILSSVDEVIENTQKQIDKLQELKKATMNELLTKGIGHTEFKDSELGRIPKSWAVKSISEVVSIPNGQVDPKIEPYASMPHIGSGNINSWTGQIKNVQTAYQAGQISGKYLFNVNHILYSKVRPNLAKVCMPQFHGVCSADIYPLLPKEQISGKFIFQYLLTERFTQIATEVSERTGMPKINRQDLSVIKLPVPPFKEQLEIAKKIEALDDAMSLKTKKLSQTQSLKKSLMQDLLTGKVRVQVN